MTPDEAAARYKIPPQVLRDHMQRSGTSEIDDDDLKRLSLLTVLYDIGLCQAAVTRYLNATNDRERLLILEGQRRAILSDIHDNEQRLSRLDVLRHQIRTHEQDAIF